jgi:hypothetical protein
MVSGSLGTAGGAASLRGAKHFFQGSAFAATPRAIDSRHDPASRAATPQRPSWSPVRGHTELENFQSMHATFRHFASVPPALLRNGQTMLTLSATLTSTLAPRFLRAAARPW